MVFDELFSFEFTQGNIFSFQLTGLLNTQTTAIWTPSDLLHDLCVLTETSVLSDVDYVLCLDSIGRTDNLFLHVSKPPKEGTPAYALVEVFVAYNHTTWVHGIIKKRLRILACGQAVTTVHIAVGFCNY